MSNRRLAVGIVFLFIAQFCAAQATPSKTEVEKRVDSILSKMTQEEKIEIEEQRVVATAKHYAGNNSEFARTTVSSDIDERTLREIYLPAFEASVKE